MSKIGSFKSQKSQFVVSSDESNSDDEGEEKKAKNKKKLKKKAHSQWIKVDSKELDESSMNQPPILRRQSGEVSDKSVTDVFNHQFWTQASKLSPNKMEEVREDKLLTSSLSAQELAELKANLVETDYCKKAVIVPSLGDTAAQQMI
jgi:hypothetical protein